MSETIEWKGQATLPVKPKALYDLFVDFTSTRIFDPSVVDARLLTSPPLQEGSCFELDFKMGLSVVSMQYTITKLKAPHYIELQGQTDQFKATDRIEISAQGDQSELTYAVAIDLNKPNAISQLMAPKLVKSAANKALKTLKNGFIGEAKSAKSFPSFLDKSLLAGAYQFTKFGFFRCKPKFVPQVLQKPQIIVVTGATSGIGQEIAIELARSGAELILPVRNMTKGEKFKHYLKDRFNTTCHLYECDFSRLDQVTQTSKKIAEDFSYIDQLINNAGILLQQRNETPEGFDENTAVLLLAPFLFTHQLMPLMLNRKDSQTAGEAARVINMLSGGMYTQSVHLDDMNYEKPPYDGNKAYARAKRALYDASCHLSRVYDKEQIVFHCMHPGWAHTPGVEKSLPGFLKTMKKALRTPFQGADTAIWLALSQQPLQSSGDFWLDRQKHTASVWPGTGSDIVKQDMVYQKLVDWLAPDYPGLADKH